MNNENEKLINAAEENDIETIKKLLALKNININYQDKWGNTALMVAAWVGNDKCVELLLNAGAKIDMQNGGGDIALIRATLNCHDGCAKLLQQT